MTGTIPLHDRVEAPEVLEPAPHPDVAEWRPARPHDLEAMVAYERAVADRDHPHWVTGRDALKELFELSFIDAEHDTLLGFDADGRLIASGKVIFPPGQETLVRAFTLGSVHPDHQRRGVGTALFDWQLGRARQRLASSSKRLPGWIIGYADGAQPGAAALLERGGLQAMRHFFALHRPLAAPIAPHPVPEGVRIVPWRAEYSEGARLARNDSFSGHWGSQSMDAEAWASMVGDSVFSPELSSVALDPDGDVIGFVITQLNRDDWEAQGFTSTYVHLVGVVTAWRGRGIAQALLTRELELAREGGYDRSVLHVDSENATGALGLYTGLGYELAHSHRSFVRVH